MNNLPNLLKNALITKKQKLEEERGDFLTLEREVDLGKRELTIKEKMRILEIVTRDPKVN